MLSGLIAYLFVYFTYSILLLFLNQPMSSTDLTQQQKRRRENKTPLTEHPCVTRPTSPPSPTSWNRACNRLRGKRGDTSPLSSKPFLSWQASHHLSVGRSSERKWVKSPWDWSTRKNHWPLWCLPTFTRTYISKLTSTGV